MTADDTLRTFYDGYFTGPHHPPRPWPEAVRLAANARLVELRQEVDNQPAVC